MQKITLTCLLAAVLLTPVSAFAERWRDFPINNGVEIISCRSMNSLEDLFQAIQIEDYVAAGITYGLEKMSCPTYLLNGPVMGGFVVNHSIEEFAGQEVVVLRWSLASAPEVYFYSAITFWPLTETWIDLFDHYWNVRTTSGLLQLLQPPQE